MRNSLTLPYLELSAMLEVTEWQGKITKWKNQKILQYKTLSMYFHQIKNCYDVTSYWPHNWQNSEEFIKFMTV
jgi:hypothetical protein